MYTEIELDKKIDAFVQEYKSDPRRKILIGSEMLALSATADGAGDFSSKTISIVIQKYLAGNANFEEMLQFDSAMYVCHVLARRCFDLEDSEDGATMSFFDADSGFVVEITPS